MSNLTGRRIAILATDGFEQSELIEPKRLLEQAGAQTDVIAPGDAEASKGWSEGEWGKTVAVDVSLADAEAENYDALVLRGRVMTADKLGMVPAVHPAVKAFDDAG